MSTDQPADWDAPLNANGNARSAALRAALGLRFSELAAWDTELHGTFSSEAWGYPQLADIADVEQRAIVADQLLGSVDGVLDALTDAGIALHQLRELTGPNGVKYSDPAETLNDMLAGERLRGSVAAFFDAAGTALDCLAAALIVVVRAPLSVQRADFIGLVGRLDPGKDYAAQYSQPLAEVQSDLWRDLLTEIEVGRTAAEPAGWLDWTLETRNALTHRGKATMVFLPRPITGKLLVPPTPRPESYYRYDMHLRKRPWLPGMEGLLRAESFEDTWLDEPADRTLAGLLELFCGFCDRLAGWARRAFQPAWQQHLLAPASRWELPDSPVLSFAGISPGGTVPLSGASGGIDREHVQLAERVRLRRAQARTK
ncbi:MAG: hypothetical protein JWR63_2309 [Conexibacter sp.]|nr:hypothetical protein [Conexibacter sp.]